MKASVYTLGCKANQFESQAMEKLLLASGCELVPQESPADIMIVNSCTVTSTADKKTRQLIRRLRREYPASLIGVCGCMAQIQGKSPVLELGADAVSGNRDHSALITELLKLAGREPCDGGSFTATGFELLPAGGVEGRTRALLKIEDGCTNYCSYCIIPYARGRVRSMPFDTAVSEARRLAGEGYREIVLTGIEISSYGADIGDCGICDLIEAVCDAAPESRIALGSLKPTVVDDKFCRRLSSCENLCRHFHLSLQSCCDETLNRMNRHYGVKEITGAAGKIREYFPDANITADLIFGFPGETEAEYRRTLDVLRELKLGDTHIFPYSVRQGTVAATMQGQVPKAEKERRCAEAELISTESRREFLRAQLGTLRDVLLETPKDGKIGGYTENYIYAELDELPELARGMRIKAKIDGLTAEGLSAVRV